MKLYIIEYWACGVKRWGSLCFFRGTFREAVAYGHKKFDPHTISRVRQVKSTKAEIRRRNTERLKLIGY